MHSKRESGNDRFPFLLPGFTTPGCKLLGGMLRDRGRVVSLATKELMMANNGPTIVGVFDESGMGDAAVDALRQAGFEEEQIYYSARPSAGAGGFVSTLKAFFTTGVAADSGNVEHTLTGMGLTDVEADYYDTEYREGHKIIAVRTDNRYEEALGILRENGGHNFYNEHGVTDTTGQMGPAPTGVIHTSTVENAVPANASGVASNPVTDPSNEMEGAYASNPALRPDANGTRTTGTTGGATPAGGRIDTNSTASAIYMVEST